MMAGDGILQVNMHQGCSVILRVLILGHSCLFLPSYYLPSNQYALSLPSTAHISFLVPANPPAFLHSDPPPPQVSEPRAAWALTGELVTSIAADIERLNAGKAKLQKVGQGSSAHITMSFEINRPGPWAGGRGSRGRRGGRGGRGGRGAGGAGGAGGHMILIQCRYKSVTFDSVC